MNQFLAAKTRGYTSVERADADVDPESLAVQGTSATGATIITGVANAHDEIAKADDAGAADAGAADADDADAPSVKTHRWCMVLYLTLFVVAFTLLLNGRRTETQTAYFFTTPDYTTVATSTGTVYAEVFIPFWCLAWFLFHYASIGFGARGLVRHLVAPLVDAAVVVPLQTTQLALWAHIGDGQLVATLVFLSLYSGLMMFTAERLPPPALRSESEWLSHVPRVLHSNRVCLYLLGLLGFVLQWIVLCVHAGWQAAHDYVANHVIGTLVVIGALHLTHHVTKLIRIARVDTTTPSDATATATATTTTTTTAWAWTTIAHTWDTFERAVCSQNADIARAAVVACILVLVFWQTT
jgi:hypothetical protein